ncbi:MAG: hypothetical protein DRP08_06770 [Candidatus Aenigmatarchaeota archaeon]|nr:MAG: hypothetical protein DRP08_06770 [Candidatus Aenigmarchaeota archaeon]
MDVMVYVNVIILIASVLILFLAIEKKDLLQSAVLLGVASAVISIAFFIADAPIAAAFELIVCAGLITVLFISTISLTRGGEDQ